MDSLVSSFNVTSLGGGVQKLSGIIEVYISEVSSPTRLWFHFARNSGVYELSTEMKNFYSLGGLEMKPDQVFVGMRVAAFAFDQWHRADVISEYNAARKSVKLFFIDYGTSGELGLNRCKHLVEQFAMPIRKAFRGALYGVQPVRRRCLWDCHVTDGFIKTILDKVHKIEIVTYHEEGDFYEFVLWNGPFTTVNQDMIQSGVAAQIDADSPCLSYPTFDMLERLAVYPTFGERVLALEQTKIDLNKFEEENIPFTADFNEFKSKLDEVLSDRKFEAIKKVFENLRSR